MQLKLMQLSLVAVVAVELDASAAVSQMKNRRGWKPYRGQAPFLFRLPAGRIEWADNDRSARPTTLPTQRSSSNSRYPPCDREGTMNPRASALETVSTVERRSDMPVVRKRELGAMSLATEAARSVKSRQDALKDLERDMYARTSCGPREALLATWEKFHLLWYGSEVPALPLTEEKLYKVTALFKAGGYKSCKNYLSRVKDAHVMSGYPWTDLLQRVAQKCSRSALRGLAGPARSEPFDLVRVHAVALNVVQFVTVDLLTFRPWSSVRPSSCWGRSKLRAYRWTMSRLGIIQSHSVFLFQRWIGKLRERRGRGSAFATHFRCAHFTWSVAIMKFCLIKENMPPYFLQRMEISAQRRVWSAPSEKWLLCRVNRSRIYLGDG